MKQTKLIEIFCRKKLHASPHIIGIWNNSTIKTTHLSCNMTWEHSHKRIFLQIIKTSDLLGNIYISSRHEKGFKKITGPIFRIDDMF